jgi:hypothetical protein
MRRPMKLSQMVMPTVARAKGVIKGEISFSKSCSDNEKCYQVGAFIDFEVEKHCKH